MFPGMGLDKRAMEAAMKKMGMKQQEIPASEVVIKSENKDIVITNPQVVKVNVMGQDSFQITGNVEEREAYVSISEDDIKTVSAQTGVPDSEAKAALEKTNGDLAAAIMELKK